MQDSYKVLHIGLDKNTDTRKSQSHFFSISLSLSHTSVHSLALNSSAQADKSHPVAVSHLENICNLQILKKPESCSAHWNQHRISTQISATRCATYSGNPQLLQLPCTDDIWPFPVKNKTLVFMWED